MGFREKLYTITIPVSISSTDLNVFEICYRNYMPLSIDRFFFFILGTEVFVKPFRKIPAKWDVKPLAAKPWLIVVSFHGTCHVCPDAIQQ